MTVDEMNGILERDGSPFHLEERNGMTFAVNGLFKFATDLTCLKLAKLPPGVSLRARLGSSCAFWKPSVALSSSPSSGPCWC